MTALGSVAKTHFGKSISAIRDIFIKGTGPDHIFNRFPLSVAAEGGSPGDIVKITTYVTSINDWRASASEQQSLFNEYFKGEYPANTLVEITALAEPGLDVEIEAIAELG